MTYFARFVLRSLQSESEPLQVGDPPLVNAGLCYTAQEAHRICFNSGELAVGLVPSLLQEQQMFCFQIDHPPHPQKGNFHD